MTVEIERKFLVAGDAWRDHVVRRRRLVQFYITRGDGRASVRVRLVEGEKAWLTIKSARGGLSRMELEYEIPIAHANLLRDLAEGAVVEKVRHDVDHAGHRWEIDIFEGDNAGLVVAEVELEAEDSAPVMPSWIGREVTHDPRYYNARLAVHPYARWRDVAPGGAAGNGNGNGDNGGSGGR